MNKTIPLWENNVPYLNKEYGDFVPSLTDYTLKTAEKTGCIIVIPGGGYSHRCEDREGSQISEMLNKNGVSSFVLNYRISPYCSPAMDEDVKRAIRYVRYNADKLNIDPEKIGVLGFSAGGHLTCMAGLTYDYGKDTGDEIDKVSCRPDLVTPCYAVSSLDKEITHKGTREAYLGNDNSDERAYKYSSENLVKEDAPPFFIWHTVEDNAVDVRNSLRLATALAEKKIPFELNIFPFGGHGLDLAKNTPLADGWFELYIKFLKHYGY